MNTPTARQECDDLETRSPDLSRSLLIICAHGSVHHSAANDHVLGMADRLRVSKTFAGVHTVFQAGEPDIWSAQDIDYNDFDKIVIVPYMMSDGFLAKQMINKTRQAIQSAGVTKPVHGAESVGTHAAITDLIVAVSNDAVASHHLRAAEVSLVIVAHGSRNAPQSRNAAEKHLSGIQETALFRTAQLAFIEEPPFITDVLTSLSGPAVVVGLFAAPGGHAIIDVSAALEEAGRDDLINAGPIGLHEDMHHLICFRAAEALPEPLCP